nr:MAG TPA: hypothetical protein [Bacteriophage sp.]
MIDRNIDINTLYFISIFYLQFANYIISKK